MIWHIAVHPDYQRRKIGFKLLDEAVKMAKELGLVYFEAWTRDDEWVNNGTRVIILKMFNRIYMYSLMVMEATKHANTIFSQIEFCLYLS